MTHLEGDYGGSRSEPARLTFEDFYTGAHDHVSRALALTLRDEELARDATAEAMVRACQRWEEVSGYDNPAGWTYRVGLNWARSRLRKWRREVRSDHGPEQAGADETVIEPRLDDALAGLSVDHRAVVVLRYYLDWSETRTAAALSIPAGTVKSRLSRAMTRLAEILEGPDGT